MSSDNSTSSPKLLKEQKCFDGFVRKYELETSKTLGGLPTRFCVFLPEQCTHDNVEPESFPVLYWLSGLTCNEDNFITKAGAQRAAADHKLVLVCPDTSPRGANAPNESDDWDFGVGAGFYVDATQPEYAKHYNMYSFVVDELPSIVQTIFPFVDPKRKSVFGHSMGGHGALVIALKNADFLSCSAFAPICHPTQCAWGKKAFSGYLGSDESSWAAYDATELVKTRTDPNASKLSILIDQGDADQFLKDGQLLPDQFVKVAQSCKSVSVMLRKQRGYDQFVKVAQSC
eukprot:CAMPEP_0201548798 /NCGR_PEP_ID=MMETSP0173_2-20130828/5303_1 /ASSEMBLY_ACC=CAM_ASM_000268 /TAXON_ID=218659 /ORGANISM="Vexillifera sp., Strain DIVA3 564/2" /LENGTH=286 /DNA_ID=CAMNT_0047958275 /DNA_START=28 /DNA_END=885 /DNA_ORIENTATION=-